MSDGLNRAQLIGNVAAVELKFTQGGQAVLRIRMATNESYLNKAGERQESTEWHSVTVWGKRAESLEKFLVKGKQIFVEGRIQTRSWEDKDGGKRYATEINASDIKLLGGGNGGGQRRDAGGDSRTGAGTSEHEYEGGGATDQDDIPFAPVGDIG